MLFTRLAFTWTLLTMEVLCAQVGISQLVPDMSFSINQGTSGPSYKVREMRSTKGGLWLLLQSDLGDFSINRVSVSGASQSRISLGSGGKPVGLAVTDVGVATVLYRDRKPSFIQYESGGQIASQIALGCAMGESLLSIGGSIGVVCPDGQITRFSAKGRIGVLSSWVRPGTLSESFGDNRLAVVDQVTGALLWNDLAAGGVTTKPVTSPELVDARLKNQAAEAATGLKQSQGQFGANQKQLMVMDTAADSKSLYLLIWPYSSNTGPSVIKVGIDGKLAARYQCTTPGGQGKSFHKIEVTDGYLFLASVTGTVYRFKL